MVFNTDLRRSQDSFLSIGTQDNAGQEDKLLIFQVSETRKVLYIFPGYNHSELENGVTCSIISLCCLDAWANCDGRLLVTLVGKVE